MKAGMGLQAGRHRSTALDLRQVEVAGTGNSAPRSDSVKIHFAKQFGKTICDKWIRGNRSAHGDQIHGSWSVLEGRRQPRGRGGILHGRQGLANAQA